jgi:hypothetical protein
VNVIQAVEEMKAGKSVKSPFNRLYRMCQGDFVMSVTEETSCAARLDSIQTIAEFTKQHSAVTEFYDK